VREPPDFSDLVGEDLPPDERRRLERVDALLRSVPAPPAEVPAALTTSVQRVAEVAPLWTRRRAVLAVALAATLCALFFGIGLRAGGDDFEAVRIVELRATENGAGAAGVIRLGARDEETGNWEFVVEVSGLRPLPEGGYYDLWLAKDREYAGACGTFNVGSDGRARVHMTASYRLSEFDNWVVTAIVPDEDSDEAPWLLEAPTQDS
jgi:hypothetical protein